MQIVDSSITADLFAVFITKKHKLQVDSGGNLAKLITSRQP